MEETIKQTTKVMKIAKVPVWSKEINIEMFEKQIHVQADINVCVVEFPISAQGKPEVIEAKMKKIQNQEDYQVLIIVI